MDPIKVDFTGKGKASVKKAKNSGLKLVINIIGTIIGAGIAYYFMLPPLNFRSYDLYIYIGVVIAIYLGFVAVTSGMIKSPDYTPYAKKLSIVPIAIAAVIAVMVGIGYLTSCVFFRADSFSKIIKVDDSKTFADDIVEVDFKSVPVLDTSAASVLAKRTLGDLSDQVSQFEVGVDFTQINYKGNPVKLATLSYGDVFKWLKNTSTGLPGYIVVNMVTQKAELVRTDESGLGFGNIRYSTYEHFGKFLKRHVRFKYPTYLLGTPTFEVNEEGYPFWLVPVQTKRVGLFGGTDVSGVLLVDAIKGDIVEYGCEEISKNPELQWIDGIFSGDLLVQQFNYYGKYSGGFWNSLIGQSGVKVATEGSNFLAMDDDVYMYTGVTSMGVDEAIIGFVLVNMRTKETSFYSVSGAKEYSAMNSARGAVQDQGWNATFPMLLNISGQPTYFMSLLDDAQLVKAYAMVNVTNYRVVVTGESIAACMEQYVKKLKENDITIKVDLDEIKDAESSAGSNEPAGEKKYISWTGTVTDIRTAVIDADSYYYLAISAPEGSKQNPAGKYFSVKAADAPEVIILNKGDKVSFKTDTDKGSIISVVSFGK